MLRNASQATTSIATALAVASCLLTLSFSAPLAAQVYTDEPPPAAELMPLAPASLLLDVLRTPEGRLVAVGERGHIVMSNDGQEWTQAESVPTRSTLTAVAVSGNDLWAAGHDTTILHSDDGGRNWTLQHYDPDRRQPIMDLHFVDADLGYAIGAYGLMMFTEDGGETWDETVVSIDEWHLNGFVDLGGDSLVITGERGYSYFSRDAGETWTIVEMPYPGSMFGALSVDGCIVVYGLRGNVQESCNDGESWEELPTPTESSLAGGAYRDGELVLVGNSGQVLIRNPDGSFRAEKHPSGVDFAAVVPLDDGRWLLVGENGSHFFPAGGGG